MAVCGRPAATPGDRIAGASGVRASDSHRPSPSAEELAAALCPVRERRVVDKTGCVSWRGRCFELTGEDATPRRRREVIVRQRLDGQVELVMLDGKRVPASRERSRSPRATLTSGPSLAERVANHAPPAKPAADHPWRKSLAVAGSVPARCARLHSASHRDPKGTLLLS